MCGLAIRCLLVCLIWPAILFARQSHFEWQETYAKVLPTGDLQWAPTAFRYKAGSKVRYIDFENGKDTNTGETKESPWKHHPWDSNASALARTGVGGPCTYVFKCGVAYRGVLRPSELIQGSAQDPLRLTADPSWGNGFAVICGSEIVDRWRQGAVEATGGSGLPGKIPDGNKVWVAEVSFLPRTLWAVSPDGSVRRLTLARTPNWVEPDPNDVMSQWPIWENPEWWKGDGHTIQVEGKPRHAGIDRKNLTGKADDYIGATVWSEWGIVMGSPYPAKVEAFDERQRAVAFRGPWTWEKSEKIIRGNRYYLEDKPQFLDEPGEYWVERLAPDRARVYLRLPDDAKPDTVAIEAGRHTSLLDAKRLGHIEISGLTFRFTNVQWEYNAPAWAHPDLRAAAIRLSGSAESVSIHHCVFEHVNMATRLAAATTADRIGQVAICDNDIRDTDHGGVQVAARFDAGTPDRVGVVDHVDFLRNRMTHIGWRVLSGEHGHAVDLSYPRTSHVAGNVLSRIAGWGISVAGGKPSGMGGSVPFSRHLIHHNRVEDALCKSNDWGAIETWQGGPFYVFNNVVINPLGYKNWTLKSGDPTSIGSFGHAYYLDGSFKNYLFNNIAAGRNNTLGTKSVNSTALQNIFSFENSFFHNTFYRFAAMTRQQAPDAGRFRYLGNVMEDISSVLFRHADPKEGTPDPNAGHYKQGGKFAYDTLAYANNVIFGVRGDFGVFEETGFLYRNLKQMSDALARLKAYAAGIGEVADRSSILNPAANDFRPSANSPSIGRGVKVFVPWSLSNVVGEWHFLRDNAEPTRIQDEHWNMTTAYGSRETYRSTPRYPLVLVGGDQNSFTDGVLENWVEKSALKLDGKTQHLRLDVASTEASPKAPDRASTDIGFATVDHPARLIPGMSYEAMVRLKKAVPGQQLNLHIHWLKPQAWGGFHGLGGKPEPVPGQENTYRIKFSVNPQPGLANYQLVLFLSPDGDFARKTEVGMITLPPGAARANQAPPTVNITNSSFIIEAVFQASDPDGVLVAKADAGTGYLLSLVNGKPRLELRGNKTSYSVTATTAISDGKWHHVLVEADRVSGTRIFIDGKACEVLVEGSPVRDSLVNAAPFLVGGGPGIEPLAMTIDFLRVAQGTLSDAQTSIGELYSWQFDGPQYRDFAATDRRTGRNAAGAIIPSN